METAVGVLFVQAPDLGRCEVRCGFFADGEHTDSFAVDTDFNLAGLNERRERFCIVPRDPYLEFVGGIQRKSVRDTDSTPCSKGQSVNVVFLREVRRYPEGVFSRRNQRGSEGHAAYFLSCRCVSLHQNRRNPQDSSHIVESVTGVVRRQQRCNIDVEREEAL